MRRFPDSLSCKYGKRARVRPFWELLQASGPAGCLVWFYPVFMAIVSRRRDLDNYASVDSSALLQMGFVCGCAFYLASVAHRYSRALPQLLFRPPLVYLLVYVVICVLSSVWSINPLLTAWRAFECLVFLLLITVATASLSRFPEDIVEWIVGRAFLSVCCSLIVQRAWVMSVTSKGLTPESMRANGLIGLLDVGPVLFLALFISKRRLVKWFLALLCGISASTRMYIGFVVGLVLGLACSRRRERHALPFILGLSVLLVLSLGTAVVVQGFFPGKTEGAYDTGRVRLWRSLLELGMDSPLIGKGFSVGERRATIEEGSPLYQSHNSFLAAFMGCGLLGVVPMLLFFISMAYWSLNQAARPAWRTGLVATVAMAIIDSMFGVSVGGRVYGSWTSVVCLAAFITSLASSQRHSDSLAQTGAQGTAT